MEKLLSIESTQREECDFPFNINTWKNYFQFKVKNESCVTFHLTLRHGKITLNLK